MGRALALMIGMALLVPPAGGLEAHHGALGLSLRPTGPTHVPQGVPFALRATLRNQLPGPVGASVLFILGGPGGSVDFRTWDVQVPGEGTAKTNVTVVSSQWFAELGSYRVSAQVVGGPVRARLSFEVTAPIVVVPKFQDVTASSGIEMSLPMSRCGEWASGAAWGDVEGDGDLDLDVPVRGEPARLWINDGSGHFTDQATERGVDNGSLEGVGAVFADFDNDGDQDLYVVNAGTNRLYRNDGTGHFVDVATQAGVADSGVGPSAAWGDYDRDGHLDLYVVNHQPCQFGFQADRLYHNEGDGTFTDRTYLIGVDATLGAGYQAAWFDYDGDGDQDLYLANDEFGFQPDVNHLWRNDGPGRDGGWVFTDVSVESRTDYAMNSMGIAIGDYDGDQDLDFAISNIGPTVLARNDGDGSFSEVAGAAGVARPTQDAQTQSVTWALGFFDFNLDRWVDLFVAAGPIGDIPTQPNEVFANLGDGTFADLSAASGADLLGSSRGVAFADYDRDGLMDLFVMNQNGSPRLYRNVTQASGLHWLEVHLTGTASNRDACGARLVLTIEGQAMVREVMCGSISLASGSDPTVHFGLGTTPGPASLSVEWPSGKQQVIADPAVDRVLEVTEPAG